MKGIVVIFAFLFLAPTAIAAQTNTWNGNYNTSWGISLNWSLGHIPTASENVSIPTGESRYPVIFSTSSYSCNSVTMSANTTLTVQGTLSIAGDLNCYGTLYVSNEQAVLNIGDDLLFQNGSVLNVPYSGADINISDDLICYAGCSVDPVYGDFKFTGANSNIIANTDIALYNLLIDSPNFQRSSGNGSLDVKGNFTLYASRSYTSSVSTWTYFHRGIWTGSGSSFFFSAGTAYFSGSVNAPLTFNGSSFFYNLSVSKTNPAEVILQSNISVAGSLTIINGVLDSNGFNILVGGDWTNYEGPTGFNERPGTGATVSFLGAGDSWINNSEAFNNLGNSKNGGALVVDTGKIVTAATFWNSDADLTVHGSLTSTLTSMGLGGTISVNGILDLSILPANSADIIGNVNVSSGGTMHFRGGVSPGKLYGSRSLHVYGNMYYHDTGLEIMDSALGLIAGDLYIEKDFLVQEIDIPMDTGNIFLTGSGDCSFKPPNSMFNLTINKASINDDVNVIGRNVLVFGSLVLTNGNLFLPGYSLSVLQGAQLGGTLRIQSGDLYLGSGQTFTVVNGGRLQIYGEPTDLSYVSRYSASGYYNLTVENGGTIESRYTVFQYMGANGIDIRSGAWIGTSYCFLHCTFTNGAPGGTLLKIANDQNVMLYAVSFPANTWGGSFNVSKTNNAGNVHMVLSGGSFSGATFESDPFGRIHWGNTLLPGNLDISHSQPTGNYTLHATFPYTGSNYTIYKCTVGPDGPWTPEFSGIAPSQAYFTFPATDDRLFFRMVLWQE